MRKIVEIPIDQIVILNPRERDPSKFDENVESIKRVGLKRPVVVNTHYLEETGKYELVCGQGRVEALKRLGEKTIPALTVDVDRPTALIMSITENATRQMPSPLWFARIVKELHDGGMTNAEIGNILGRSTESVRLYLNLLSEGEETLLEAVEKGSISVSLAIEIAKTPEQHYQKLLKEGYETGLIKTNEMKAVQRMIDLRRRFGKTRPECTRKKRVTPLKTLDDLREEIKRTLARQEDFVQKSQRTENRLMILSEEFGRLHRDPLWLSLVESEHLTDFPKLKGDDLVGMFDYFNTQEV